MKRLLAVLGLILALASDAGSQGAAKEGQLALLYDVDSATLTYCVTNGADKGPFTDPISVLPKIKTTGASTTVTELTASTNPFTTVAVGDVLVILTPSTTDPLSTTLVVVTAKASAASITVDTAINITGNSFGYYRNVCGTTAADGWFAVPAGAARVSIGVQYDQGDLDALTVRWECKASGAGAQPVILYPGEGANCGIGGTLSTDRCSFATAGITSRVTVVDESPAFAFCRVGLAFAATDAADTTVLLEKVTVKVAVR